MGLFKMARHAAYACVVSMMRHEGCVLRIAGVYTPPRLSGPDMRRVISEFGMVDVMGGDFNARHPRWSDGLD